MPQEPKVNLPTVGIVIPCYNMGDTIHIAVDSIIEQDYPQKCIIIVDDGSIDDSWTKITALVPDVEISKDDKDNYLFAGIKHGTSIYGIKLAQHTNQCNAKNVGIQSVGHNVNIFGFLDADDYYLPGKISKSVIEFLDNPEVIGLVYSDYYVDIDGCDIPQFLRSFDRQDIYNTHYNYHSFFVSAVILNKIGLFDISLPIFENYDILLRAAEHSILIHIPEQLATIKVNNKGVLSQAPPHIHQGYINQVLARAQQRNNAKI